MVSIHDQPLSSIFLAHPDLRLSKLSLARENDSYRLVGTMLAWSVVHGGPGGNFFSPTLYNSIVYGPETNCRLEDVPDSHLKHKISQVSFASHLSGINLLRYA